MPSWRPLPRIAFAVCIYPFQPSAPSDLPLEIGDELYIIEQGGKDGAWYRGYLVAPPSLLAGLTSVKGQTLEARVFSGIFPRCCVEVRELLGAGKVEGRTEEAVGKTQLSTSRPGTRDGHAEPRTNGAMTPTGSSTSNSLAGKLPGLRGERNSKLDAIATPSTARPVSQSKSNRGRRRGDSHGSQWTSRSDHLQQLGLPLSPVSVASRDPNAPRPPAPVPMLKIGDETPTSFQEPLVDEIASCLREWHSTKLHELLLSRRYSTLDTMSNLVQRLDTARRQLLHGVLTAQELRSMREATVWDLVNGNKLLSGEVIVRNPTERGRILTAEDSAIEVTRLQSMMSLLNDPPPAPAGEHVINHLFAHVKTVLGDLTIPALQISMQLCLKAPGTSTKPLSESYAMELSTRDGVPIVAPEKMRTLFTDIGSTDIGEGAAIGSQLYLVFKVVCNEPIRAVTSGAGTLSRENSTSPSASAPHSSSYGNAKGGRRSLMFGHKARKASEVGMAPIVEYKQSRDSESGKSPDSRPGSATARTSPPPKDQKMVKRTVAVGIIQVDTLMRARGEAEVDVPIWSSAMPFDDVPTGKEEWDPLLKDIQPSPTGKYKVSSSIKSLRLYLKSFSHPDAETLIEKIPTLLHKVKQTHKMGFSGAPTKARSDIYVTLVEPFLPRNACLSHPKTGTTPLAQPTALANLQLTIEVRRSTGERIENCIYPSSNSTGHTAWRTTATERSEPWNATIRLAITPEDVPGCHIVMSIADAPGFPFALCWMPLWNQDAFARDGDHSLTLYKYDEYTSSMISGRGAYLALPWSAKRKDEAVTGPVGALRLRTFLCSTKYSQDPSLLGLLKWKEQDSGQLTALLRRFTFVPEIEIVKLLDEVFDALFQILAEDREGREEIEDLVFDALVTVLGIVHDRRFKLAPLVDRYAETKFSYPFATPALIRSFARTLANPTDPETSRRLRSTFKVGSHMFKFIVNAREQQKEKEAGIGIRGQATFTKDLKKIFGSLESLMKNPAATLIGTKTLVVQNFHTWLPELQPIMATKEILKLTESFMDSCADVQGKLVLYKLVLIYNISRSNVFRASDVRRRFLTDTQKWLAPYWGKTAAVTDQWKDQVRLCCSVVASQVDELGQEACEYIPKLVDSYRALQGIPRPTKTTLSLLFPTSYPFPSRPVTTRAEFDEALVEISAVLGAMSNVPAVIHLDWPKDELADFMFNTLQVYISILDCEAFPSSWLSVRIYHHKSTMRMLEKLGSILIDSYLPHPDEADQFNTDLWRAFFDVLLKLVGSDALALETFPEQKRRAVWKIAGDVRELGADLLRRSWEAIGWETSAEEKEKYGLEKMGGFQVQYVPGLVSSIVELCLSVHEGLRRVAVEILQTMIVSEWTLSQDLALIQAEMIDCLDHLFKSKHLTESILQKLFIAELVDLFEPLSHSPNDPLYAAVKELIGTIDELLDLLVAVYSNEATGEVFHLMDTLHLMEFLKDMQKEDIYIRYVHQLAKLQADAGNFTEAGLALRLHAELYVWDPTVSVEAIEDPSFPEQSAFERKEQLYFQMIRYYEDGSSWDNALQTYQELAAQYEHTVFDFSKLARTQRAMATIYESISKGERQNPRYFRVVYKGLGFPPSLRDKQFIFEGTPTDRLSSFIDRMQQQHPAAQVLQTEGEPEDLEGQYLQIFPVSPQKDLLHPIYQRTKVAQPIRDYYLLSRPNYFAASRRHIASGDIKEQTVEKDLYTTAEPFPTILRRSEIISVATVTLTPLETAVERTARKTAELAAFERRISDGDDTVFSALTDTLAVIVNPNSETSVFHYRDLLPNPRVSASEIGEDDSPNLLENALKVVLTDFVMTVKRCLALYTRPAQQATRAELAQNFEAVFGPELACLVPPAQPQIVRSRNGSWLVSGSIPSVKGSPAPKLQQAEQVYGISDVEIRPTRHEKNRLSLTFLKRASFDGVRNGSVSQHEETSTSRSRSASGTNHRHRLSFLQQTGTNDSSSKASYHERGYSVDRASSHRRSTRSRSNTADRSISEQQQPPPSTSVSSSVKKRLSLLTLGKKASKTSVKTSRLGGTSEE